MRYEALLTLERNQPNQFQVSSSEQLVQKFSRRNYLPILKDSVWKIHQGVVRTVHFQEDGTIISLGIWGAGEIVGHAISQLNSYFLECLTPVEAESISMNEVHRDSDLLLSQMHQLECLLCIRGCRRVEEMVVELLKFLSDKFGRVGSQGKILDLRLTHQDIADILGTTRVTVTRIMQKLEANGTIERISIRRIVLKDLDGWYYQI